jgi:hypothetical protein
MEHGYVAYPTPAGQEGVELTTIIGSLVPTPIPEPTTMLLLRAGIAGLGAFRIRKRDK